LLAHQAGFDGDAAFAVWFCILDLAFNDYRTIDDSSPSLSKIIGSPFNRFLADVAHIPNPTSKEPAPKQIRRMITSSTKAFIVSFQMCGK
jgi:hypothetical protein